jgi:hypothetical protein
MHCTKPVTQKRKNNALLSPSFCTITSLALALATLGACSEASTQPNFIRFEQVQSWQNCPVESGESAQKNCLYFFENPTKATAYLPELASFANKTDSPLLLIGLGQRPSGGYRIQATNASLNSPPTQRPKLTITADFVAPSADQMSTMALTAPCTLIQIDKLPAIVEISVVTAEGEPKINQNTPWQTPPKPAENGTKPKTEWHL